MSNPNETLPTSSAPTRPRFKTSVRAGEVGAVAQAQHKYWNNDGDVIKSGGYANDRY